MTAVPFAGMVLDQLCSAGADKGEVQGCDMTTATLAGRIALMAVTILLIACGQQNDGALPPGMVPIPGGTFTMGIDHPMMPEAAPVHAVTVSSFAIDAAPVTNRQFADFISATGYVTLAERSLDPADFPDVTDRATWPEARRQLAARFAERTRAEWCAALEGTDACFAPVLSLADAPAHPHHAARGTFVEVDGLTQPAPAPRFSATPAAMPAPPCAPGEGGESALRDWGIAPERIEALTRAGILARRED